MSDSTIHVHQCPYCELRFRSVNEVREHVIDDHPTHAAEFRKSNPHELP
jgi:hypothetical protein